MAQKTSKKSIDNVNIQNLDVALRMFGISIEEKALDIIIDVVKLLEEKGDHTTLKDVCKLEAERNKNG